MGNMCIAVYTKHKNCTFHRTQYQTNLNLTLNK